MDFITFITGIGNAFIQGLVQLMNVFGSAVLDSVKYLINGIFAGFGAPFSFWSSNLAQNVSITLPIIFVSILGVALLILLLFVDIFGFEKDLASIVSEAISGVKL
jgi:Na+-driven multidrug efflux pump